jgi:hypothetical protein
MDNSDMPLQLTGEAKLGDLIFMPAAGAAERAADRAGWRFTPARCCVRAGGSSIR